MTKRQSAKKVQGGRVHTLIRSSPMPPVVCRPLRRHDAQPWDGRDAVSGIARLAARRRADDNSEATWPKDLADALIEAGIEVGAWVPDKRLAPIAVRLAERGIPLRTLTREEECFGYAAGFRAAGGMPLVMVQCSGLGNSLNAIGSLVIPYGLGFPVVVSMRGTLGERNPSQMPLGRTTVGMLDALGVQAFSLTSPDAATTIAGGAVGVADGARVLAPILLEAELERA
jgi:sulfopyruvate decarboxylase subunit alpha